MPVHTIQPTFAGGEFAPSLASRIDIQKYATGLRRAKNMIVHPHGGISNKPGTRYVAPAKYNYLPCRIISFEFSSEQTYILEVGAFYIRFFMNGGQVQLSVKTWQNQVTREHLEGELLKYGSAIYRCKTTYTQGTFSSVNQPDSSPDYWELTNEISVWNSGSSYSDGQAVLYSGRIYRARGGLGPGHQPDISPDQWDQSTAYEIPTPYGFWELGTLKFAQSADLLYLVSPYHPPMVLARLYHDKWTLTKYDFKNGPFMPANTDSSKKLTCSGKTGTITLTADFDIFKPEHVGALFSLKHQVPSGATGLAVDDEWREGQDEEGYPYSYAIPGIGTTGAIKCGGVWRLKTKGTWTGKMKVERSTTASGPWSSVRIFSSNNDSNFNTFGGDPAPETPGEPFYVRLNMFEHTSGTPGADLTTDAFTQAGIVKITGYTGPRSVTAEVLSELGSASATADWAEGSWSDHRGYPSTVTFYQDRLAFAGTRSEPQTTWFTKTGNYSDFGRSTPLVDTDGVSVPLPSRKMNGIRSLIALSDLLAMTSSTEWSIGPGDNGILSPTSVKQKCESYRGCSTVEPVVIGTRAVFVQPMGSVVRDIGYEFARGGFDGDDLSLLANHLFQGQTIVDMAFQQEPDSLLWCVRADGKLLSLTYKREQEVLAWTWHETAGQYRSIASIPGNGYNEIWFVVQRATGIFIERMERRAISTDPKDQYYVDCGLTYTGEPTELIGGLEHLEGQEVAILADGSVQPRQIVTSGQITLMAPASVVHVGLPYESDVETLNIELNLQDGTLQDRKVKVTEATFRFLNSRGGWIGPDENSLDEVAQLDPDNLDAPIALFTGDYPMTLDSGYGDGGRVFFRQKDPLPVTILAIIPNVTPGG